jgi:hypothetical protein
VPSELPDDLHHLATRVGVDALPGIRLLRTLKAPTSTRSARASNGKPPAEALLERAAAAVLGAPRIALDGLAILGPIFVLKLRLTPPGFGRKLVVELGSTGRIPSRAVDRAATNRCSRSPPKLVPPRQERRRSLGRTGDEDGKALEYFARAGGRKS